MEWNIYEENEDIDKEPKVIETLILISLIAIYFRAEECNKEIIIMLLNFVYWMFAFDCTLGCGLLKIN